MEVRENNGTQFTQSLRKGISGFLHPEELPAFIIQNTFYPPGKPRWILINILFPGDAVGLAEHLHLKSPALEVSYLLTKEKEPYILAFVRWLSCFLAG